jgi:hypothetical protein
VRVFFNGLLFKSTIATLLVTGCGSLKHPYDLPLRYQRPQYGLTLYLPASWRGYSVLIQEWVSETYLPAADKTIVTDHGPMITLRYPQWKAGAPHQDIPILVFTRTQWDALHHGNLWPSLYAGGAMDELWHSREYVFGISSRYNWGELAGSKEAAEIVERNRAVQSLPRLYPE